MRFKLGKVGFRRKRLAIRGVGTADDVDDCGGVIARKSGGFHFAGGGKGRRRRERSRGKSDATPWARQSGQRRAARAGGERRAPISSMAAISAARSGGSDAAWPASGTIRNSASVQASARSAAARGGHSRS